MKGALSRCLDAVTACVFCLFLLLGGVAESQAQPRVDESSRPYLSGAAQSALFGPNPQSARERTVPETLQAIPAQPTIGANIQVNDSSTEDCPTTGCTQSETSIAVDPTNPNNIIVGWNDGVGFFNSSVFDISGYGFSLDGGKTWTDGGTPPNSSSTIRISGDPALAVCGDGGVHYANIYVDTVDTFSGLSVNNGSFGEDTVNWLDLSPPIIAVSSMSDFLDKEYLVCDPVSNTLYMSYTRFIGGGGNGQIEFVRSTDGGVTWSSPVILQSEELIVNQGSYPAVGPGGQVCVAWERDFLATGGDPHISVRCSTDYGVTFASRVRVGDASPISAIIPPNGYNRPSLNDFPSIAIDTSGGPYNGNIYVVWHTTLPPPPPPPPGPCIWEADFESGAGGFAPGNVITTLTWQLTTNRGTDPGHSTNTSYYFGDPITFNYDTGDAEGATLDSPPIDLTGLSPPLRLDLNYFLETEQFPTFDVAAVQISAGGETGFITVASNAGTGEALIDGSDVWNSVAINLNDFAGQTIIVRFVFDTIDGGVNNFEGFYVDDVCINQAEAPSPVFDLRDVVFSRSTDGGATWSSPLQVNDDPPGADQWWPWVSVNENGEVGMIWYDRRIDPLADDLTDVYFARSVDGGMTFESNVRVTETATSWPGTGSDGVTPNFGDYINLATGSPNFHATWTDGRLGDPDVFYSTIVNPPLDKLVVGLGSYPSVGGFAEVFATGYTHDAWLRVKWSAYNSANGETRIATGDIDGDGKDEIVIGLGTGGKGFVEVLDDASTGYAHLAWPRVNWTAYNSSNGETWPACGDIDGDGKDEIVIGLGSGGSGFVEVLDDASAGYAHLAWPRVNWTAYNSTDGKTWPACGDVDGDGKDEIAIGLGADGSGYLEVLDDASAGYAHLAWPVVKWYDYNANNGVTRPAFMMK